MASFCAPVQRSPRLPVVLLALVGAVAFLRSARVAFLVAAGGLARTTGPTHSAGIGAAAGVAAISAGTFGAAVPAAAEEGLLNFGKLPLGGGFAINLDIPETGIVNIVVLIGGLLYLLGPLLSESMSTREKEIQTDIDDAIAKFDEATKRLAEAQKAKAQADGVIAEIIGSIEKDQKEFEATLKAQGKTALAKQAAAAEQTLKELQAGAQERVDSYIKEQAVNRGLKELMSLSAAQKSKFMETAISSI